MVSMVMVDWWLDVLFLDVLFYLKSSTILYLCVCVYIHMCGFIDSRFAVICNKGILRHPGSVTCASAAESSHTHGWETLKGPGHDCSGCYQQGLHAVPLSHDTFSAVHLRAIC